MLQKNYRLLEFNIIIKLKGKEQEMSCAYTFMPKDNKFVMCFSSINI